MEPLGSTLNTKPLNPKPYTPKPELNNPTNAGLANMALPLRPMSCSPRTRNLAQACPMVSAETPKP